jgi:hypothetical protein
MRPQLPLKTPDLRLVSQDIVRARQELQPDRIELQSPQPQHPLQRNGKISPAFAILRRKPAAKKDCHASRIVILLACSSVTLAILEDLAVWQMRLAMILMAAAKIGIRYRDNRPEELRLLANIQCLLQRVAEAD